MTGHMTQIKLKDIKKNCQIITVGLKQKNATANCDILE
jgi:hypothetical protein